MQSKILVLIFARSNSKRLKRKNLISICGTSLIERTLNFALKISDKKNILVSTDDKEIIEIARKKKVLCPWKRPKYLSRDNSSSYSVAKHAINWYEKNVKNISYILLLQPTTPYRDILDLKRIYKLFKIKKKTIISYSKIINKHKTLKKYFSYKKKFLNKKYLINDHMPNGAYFFIKKENLFKSKSFYSNSINPYIISKLKYGIDIDTQLDYKLAKKYEHD